MIQRNEPLQHSKQRSVRRCSLVASAEVIDLHSGARLAARTSELGLGGSVREAVICYFHLEKGKFSWRLLQ